MWCFVFSFNGDHRDLRLLTHSFPTRRSSELRGVACARAGGARGEGNRQADVGVARQARIDDARLAGTRRRRDDEEGAAHVHSMFCTCSRTWSISTLSSTAAAEVRASTDFEPRVLASRLNSCSRKSSRRPAGASWRSEEHTSELQSLMRISYAVFCLKKKNKLQTH